MPAIPSFSAVPRAGVAVLALLQLTGCNRGGENTTPAPVSRAEAKPSAPAPDPAVIAANRSMAGGVPLGTSRAPVEVRFDLVSVPQPGQPFRVGVAILPGAPALVLRAEVSGDEGLTIVAPDAPLVVEKVPAGALARLEVAASASVPGTRLLNVRVTLEQPDGPESRSFAFPVVVGPVVAPPPPSTAARPATG